MSSKKFKGFRNQNVQQQKGKFVDSLFDTIIEGKEFVSIVNLAPKEPSSLDRDLRRAIHNISEIRNRPCVCYVANIINPRINGACSIDNSDDIPFLEMIKNIPEEAEGVDIFLVTPGGSATKVENWVTHIRKRFNHVGFILPYLAMSAGTIFCLSGDELIMTAEACIGPIDPQVPSKNGRYVPAQSLLTLLNKINANAAENINQQKPIDFSDLLILQNLDAKEIGSVYNASDFSTRLVAEYLEKYKFKHWYEHKRKGGIVTQEEKKERAKKIAAILCDHSKWLSHSQQITREKAWEECELEIIRTEDINELDQAVKKLWALLCWYLERSNTAKVFLSENYSIFRQDTLYLPRSDKNEGNI